MVIEHEAGKHAEEEDISGAWARISCQEPQTQNDELNCWTVCLTLKMSHQSRTLPAGPCIHIKDSFRAPELVSKATFAIFTSRLVPIWFVIDMWVSFWYVCFIKHTPSPILETFQSFFPTASLVRSVWTGKRKEMKHCTHEGRACLAEVSTLPARALSGMSGSCVVKCTFSIIFLICWSCA